MRELFNMIEQTSVKHADVLNKVSQPLLQHFDINYCCYQHVSNDGQWFTLGNNADWLFHSAASQHYLLDPSLAAPCHYREGICIVADHQDKQFQEQFNNDARDNFDISNSVAIIKPSKQGCDMLFLATSNSHPAPNSMFVKNSAILQNEYFNFFIDTCQPALNKAIDCSVVLTEICPQVFCSDDNILNSNQVNRNEDKFLKAILDKPTLSRREQACLDLYRQGYSAKESARKLNLSFRTIEDYFESIKQKYNVKTKRALLRQP